MSDVQAKLHCISEAGFSWSRVSSAPRLLSLAGDSHPKNHLGHRHNGVQLHWPRLPFHSGYPMWLLQIEDDGSLSLVETYADKHNYAILSHTWSTDEADEITFNDIRNGTGRQKSAWKKLEFCKERAMLDRLQYFWVDTCCIDRSSSAELSEAINSMFRWYQKSERCYVYLTDVYDSERQFEEEGLGTDDVLFANWRPAFRQSRWFRRGWTLQELLAPAIVEFFSAEGAHLGNKTQVVYELHRITGIHMAALEGRPLSNFDVEERIRWSMGRSTKREEDAAYCLLGICGISMSAIYGEGKDQALKRLRDQVEKRRSEDFERLLSLLSFDQFGSRYANVNRAHAQTCAWLLKEPVYQNWTRPSHIRHRLLWIKAKPGSGKSTLMKFALENTMNSEKNGITLSYFFHARGGTLEKSVIGAYRTLLIQLLQNPQVQRRSLQRIFGQYYSLAWRSTTSSWTLGNLKGLLGEAIESLHGIPLAIFVDALDEGSDDDIRGMVSFFEKLLEQNDRPKESESRLRICFASRHYPNITVRAGSTLLLDEKEGHRQDIINYLSTELRLGSSSVAQEIRAQILAKSSGIFMWVVLVTGLLNRDYDRGRLRNPHRRIAEIPGDLHKLFYGILTRSDKDRDDLAFCLQLILFVTQPLTIQQAYHATTRHIDQETLSPRDVEHITTADMKRFLLDVSKGLLEVSGRGSTTVQFIHETVKNFLLDDQALTGIWPQFATNLEASGHERVKTCCASYFCDNIGALFPQIFDLPDDSTELLRLRSAVDEAFPFLKYATENTLFHANEAEKKGLSQKDFIQCFDFKAWVTFYNVYTEKTHRHTPLMDPLHILAENNMADLIKCNDLPPNLFGASSEPYGSPFIAALATRCKAAALALLDVATASSVNSTSSLQMLNPQNGMPWQGGFKNTAIYNDRDPCVYMMKCAPEHLLVALLDKGLLPVVSSNASKMLAHAMDRCFSSCILRLVRHITDIDARIKFDNGQELTPLEWAAYEGDTSMALLFLGRGATATSHSLATAARMGHVHMVELLLESGADSNAQVAPAPLQAAAHNGDVRIMQILLDAGANVDRSFALQEAAWYGHTDAVVLLLHNGADVNIRSGEDPFTALASALYRNFTVVAGVLREHGAIDS